MTDKRSNSLILKAKSDKIFDIINYSFLCLVLLVVLYPLYIVVIASFSGSDYVMRGEVWIIPQGFSIDGYKRILEYGKLWRGYLNTIIYTIIGTTVNVIFTLLAAYALTQKELVGRKFFTTMFLIIMFFNGGLIPTYLTVKSYGLIDSMWALILPTAVSTYNMIICRTFFENSIPKDLWESAQLDGCSHTRFFIRIVMPLSKAIIAVMILYYAVGHWNSYFNAMIYLTSQTKFTLQIILREILIINSPATDIMSDTNAVDELYKVMLTMKYSSIIISTVPMLILYLSVQKHFTQGIMLGAIKG